MRSTSRRASSSRARPMAASRCGSPEAGLPRRIQATMRHPQLRPDGELQHLLSIDGLSREMIHRILDTASNFVGVSERDVKKVPLLRGKSVFNLFFENSTRTRTTFEIAAKRLSADVVNLNINTSSTSK